MALYDFQCAKCDAPFEIVQRMCDYEGIGECPRCGNISKDRILSPTIYFIGTSVQHAEYNPAFGKVVKNSNERKELAKRHNLIEIGNEKPETIHKHFDTERENKLKKAWDSV